MKDAKITICRTSSSHEGDFISLQVDDPMSGLVVIRCKMTLDDFARAVTGHGHMDAEVTHFNTKNIGKRQETKTILIPRDEISPSTRTEKAAIIKLRPEVKKFTKKGWEILCDGTKVQQNYPDKYKVVLCRYVEDK